MKATLVMAITLLSASASSYPARPLLNGVTSNASDAAAFLIPLAEPAARMVMVKDKDVSGQVLKRLGLPNQDYCWQQCLQDQRCTGTRWGAIAGAEAGQCQLMSGELTFGPPRDLRTEDGKRIEVSASRKETGERKADKSGA
jgi:hypothetical protein